MKLNKVLSQNGMWPFKHVTDTTGIFVCPSHFSLPWQKMPYLICHTLGLKFTFSENRYGNISTDTYQRFLTLGFLTTSVHALTNTWLPCAVASVTWVLVSCLQMPQ